MEVEKFQQLLSQKGQELYRSMPWRDNTQPYFVLVSELMLQQTQVDRVIPKFLQFTRLFPNSKSLSNAPLSQVLTAWQGLGYNRRAKYLHLAAQTIENKCNGEFPSTYEKLITLPGVGPNTAGAIMAYAYNLPALFVETNIRTVYTHHFFEDNFNITDKQILEFLSKTIDQNNPRQFYWSLMDYGSYLKRSGIKNNTRSKHYIKQSPLKGSLREARGIILKQLTQSDVDINTFRKELAVDDRFDVALEGLIKDGLVISENDVLKLPRV